jgi:hypothetical protein
MHSASDKHSLAFARYALSAAIGTFSSRPPRDPLNGWLVPTPADYQRGFGALPFYDIQSVRLRTALPSSCGVQRRPRRSIRRDVSVAIAPSLRSSPERASPSEFTRRISFARCSGSGEETTSANVARNAPASVSGSCIVRSSGTSVGRRIATGSPTKSLPPRGCVPNRKCASRLIRSAPAANYSFQTALVACFNQFERVL